MDNLKHTVIARNQNYLMAPDVALAADGKLVCAYREGDQHSPTWSNFSGLMLVMTNGDSSLSLRILIP